MFDKNQEKAKLKDLIDNFKANYQSYKKLSEADIETKLVEELFVNILGWNKNDFKKQEKVHRGEARGRADYSFYINDKIVFFLEVKKVGISIEKEADKQVISYALSKRVPFAVSTNFDEMKIFCVEEEKESNRLMKRFISPDHYLLKFDDLWLLSKESFLKNKLLEEAENLNLLKKRMSIDKPLLQDLMYIRKEIASDIEKTYKIKFTIEEKDEIVQRIIDRLIFMRCCEDKEISPENLIIKEIANEVDYKVYKKLKLMFGKYNDMYNSGLFAPNKDNECDNIELDGGIIKKLVKLLYESKNNDFIYNFEWIGADVLGQVYEQYLGMILSQTKSGNAKLKEGQVHKKEQGIYYTPTYIVEYIVNNTIGELLKDKKIDHKNIKILDPACGSGSFLIQAFDVLNNELSTREEHKQNKIDTQGMYSLKTEILKKNIYGVDLDNKAVEITKLNLLLKASEKYRKLPSEVDLHIKHGNSLIDDNQIAGLDAFKWEEQFPDIIQFDKDGKLKSGYGFDIIIGNPPYFTMQSVGKEIQNFFENSERWSEIYRGQSDILYYFIIHSLKILKIGGLLGFITSRYWLENKWADKLRKFILDNAKVVKIIDFREYYIFPEANIHTCIIILQKETDKSRKFKNKVQTKIFSEKNIQDISDLLNKGKYTELSQRELPNDIWIFDTNKDIISKIEKNSVRLEELSFVSKGMDTGLNSAFIINSKTIEENNLEKEILKKVTKNSAIDRYILNDSKLYLIYTTNETDINNYPNIKKWLDKFKKELTNRWEYKKGGCDWFRLSTLRSKELFDNSNEKIFVPYRATKNKFTIDKNKFYGMTDTTIIVKKNDNLNNLYLLGVLNSQLMNFYVSITGKKKENLMNILQII